jgi:hypothetical protein
MYASAAAASLLLVLRVYVFTFTSVLRQFPHIRYLLRMPTSQFRTEPRLLRWWQCALLLIMLVGLLHLRRHGGGTFGIAQLLWKQV